MVARTRLSVMLKMHFACLVHSVLRIVLDGTVCTCPQKCLALAIATEARQQQRTTTSLVAGQDFVLRPSFKFHHGKLLYGLTEHD
jgi:hypothetical protein